MITDDMIEVFQAGVARLMERNPDASISEATRAGMEAVEGMILAGQWRPIETAPKDGARFLTWEPRLYGVRVGRAHIRADHDDWLSHMDGDNGSSKGGLRPTHWMPLPPEPEVKP